MICRRLNRDEDPVVGIRVLVMGLFYQFHSQLKPESQADGGGGISWFMKMENRYHLPVSGHGKGSQQNIIVSNNKSNNNHNITINNNI